MSLGFHPIDLARRLFSVDVRALAAFRISLGLLILADLWMRCEFLTEHYTDAGVMPRDTVGLTTPGFVASLYMLNGSTWFAGLLFAASALCAALLVVGYKTRFAVPASLVFIVSLRERNELVCNAGDILLGVMLFWSLFLPLGAVWSVDCHASRSRTRPQTICTPASAAILLQIVAVYFFSALLKQHPVWNANHLAVYYALGSPYSSDLGLRASHWPPSILRFITAYVWRLELLGWLPAFSPFGTGILRILVPVTFLSFHLGLAVMMSLGLFPWISMAPWLLFLPAAFWDRLDRTRVLSRLGSTVNHVLSRMAAFGEALPRSLRFARPSACYAAAGPVSRWLPALAMVYVVGVNVASLYPAYPLPTDVQRWGQRVGIYQRWRMFAPAPRRNHGWFVAPAQLADGTTIDLIRPDDPIEVEPAPVAQRGQHNKLWRCYLNALDTNAGHNQTPNYVRWLRRRWEEGNPPERQVRSVELRFEIEFLMPPGQAHVRTSSTLYNWVRDGDERLAPLRESWNAIRAAVQGARAGPGP